MLTNKHVFILILCIVVSGCTSNRMYRDAGLKNCVSNSCSESLIERHSTKNENYDLAFIEFTDQGNLFSRENFNKVIKHISDEEQDGGVSVIVYVHGWKHNAGNSKDGDVAKFRKVLKIASQGETNPRKVIGVYVGWRGLSLDVPIIKNLTYWERKRTAQKVGSGGLTEVLLRINKVTKNSPKNSNIVIGHSFGAAAVLTATKEIIIQKIVNAELVNEDQVGHPFENSCKSYIKTSRFGDGIYLLNPAIEANEMLQIKELINDTRCYSAQQPKLLHILTSKEDLSTKILFYGAQQLWSWFFEREVNFVRKFRDHDAKEYKNIKIYEEGFNGMTVGNNSYYRTSSIYKESRDSCGESIKKTDLVLAECYKQKESDEDDKFMCVRKDHLPLNIPNPPYNPVSVVYVSENLIKDHNDITNSYVASYITTSVVNNQFNNSNSIKNNINLAGCFKTDKDKGQKNFSFTSCLNHYRSVYKEPFCKEFPSN